LRWGPRDGPLALYVGRLVETKGVSVEALEQKLGVAS